MLFSGANELLVEGEGGDKNLGGESLMWGEFFLVVGDEIILNWQWSSLSRGNPVIPYIKAIKRKTLFTFLKN